MRARSLSVCGEQIARRRGLSCAYRPGASGTPEPERYRPFFIENQQQLVSIDTTPHMEAFSLFERACGCGVPSVWWHRKAPCGGVARFRLEGKGGGVGDGHVASVVSLVTWGDACVARATQRPFPVDVGVTSARCGGGATPKLAFFMRREPQEHPFWGGSAILATFAYLPVGFYR